MIGLTTVSSLRAEDFLGDRVFPSVYARLLQQDGQRSIGLTRFSEFFRRVERLRPAAPELVGEQVAGDLVQPHSEVPAIEPVRQVLPHAQPDTVVEILQVAAGYACSQERLQPAGVPVI
jgi:hypothetical protein